MSGYSQHIVEYVSELLQLLKTCTLNEKAIASFIAQLLQVTAVSTRASLRSLPLC